MRFDLNPHLDAELDALPGTRRAKREVAKAIVDRATVAAPVDSQHYRRGLRWVDRPDVTAAAATDIASHLIEFGSMNNPAFAPLRGAARSLGLRFTAAPRV